MAEQPQPVDFDSRPPMPVSEYEQTVKRVNMGYDLLFTLAGCFLRALHQPELNLLVVGAGGGMEIARFLPPNPRWRLTGVDPSQDMLALAQQRADYLRVKERVSLHQGLIQNLQSADRFDAATCLFVLHFLPDNEKLALLRGIAERLRPGAPLLLGSPVQVDDGGLRDDLLGAWQEYGELMGMPPEQMAATIERLVARPANSEEDYEHLMREAGFKRVNCFFSALAFKGWIVR